jgi:hypothetical protein
MQNIRNGIQIQNGPTQCNGKYLRIEENSVKLSRLPATPDKMQGMSEHKKALTAWCWLRGAAQMCLAACFGVAGIQPDQPRPALMLVGAAVFAVSGILSLQSGFRRAFFP